MLQLDFKNHVEAFSSLNISCILKADKHPNAKSTYCCMIHWQDYWVLPTTRIIDHKHELISFQSATRKP